MASGAHPKAAPQRERVEQSLLNIRQILDAFESCVRGEVDSSGARDALATATGSLIGKAAVLDELRLEGGR